MCRSTLGHLLSGRACLCWQAREDIDPRRSAGATCRGAGSRCSTRARRCTRACRRRRRRPPGNRQHPAGQPPALHQQDLRHEGTVEKSSQRRGAKGDRRQRGLEHDRAQPNPPEQAEVVVGGVQPASHVQRNGHPGAQQADARQPRRRRPATCGARARHPVPLPIGPALPQPRNGPVAAAAAPTALLQGAPRRAWVKQRLLGATCPSRVRPPDGPRRAK